jgi:hypothetical protein
MAGSRDDGTSAEDKAHHQNRKVSREAILDKHIAQQQAMWQGIDAASIADKVSELDEESYPGREELDPWDQEDIDEQQTLKEERLKRGYY